MSARQDLIAIDRKHVWRPYTSSEDHERKEPLVISRAEGQWLYDASGKRFLDASGSWWCNNLGHGHPRLREALVRQASDMMHCTFAGVTHEPAALLAQELTHVAPEGLTRVFYSDNGSTSVEVALKIAFQYWQQNGQPKRRRFIALPGGYHGDTIGVMSVSAVSEFSAVFDPLLFDTIRGDDPGVHADGQEAGWEHLVTQIEATLDLHGDTIAGLVIEPLVQGSAGMRMYSPALLRRMRRACDRAGTFLICDEVFTGFGRTGEMWASDHADIAPDLLCTAKGLSGGVLPFSATLATERIYDGFRGDKTRALMHGHTFCGNPLGAAVAREVLAIYREEDVLSQAKESAQTLATAIADMNGIEGVRRTRSCGMVAAIDLGDAGYYGPIGWEVHEEALARGAHMRPLGNTVYVIPSLTIPRDDLDTLLRVLRESIEATLQKRAKA